METRLVGFKNRLKLAFGDNSSKGLVVGAPNVLLGLLVPEELPMNDGISEGEEVGEDMRMDGVARRERACHLSAGALVGEDPEVELGEEASEVRECYIGWGRKCFDPEGGADLDRILLEERVRVLIMVVVLDNVAWWL